MASPSRSKQGTPRQGTPTGTKLRPPGAPARSNSYLGALRATTMMNSKAALPAEIIDLVLEHLPVADLVRCARASKRMQEMVYDDTRWVRRLQLMGCWSERQARQRVEEAVLRKVDAQKSGHAAGERRELRHGEALFDAGWETQTQLRPAGRGRGSGKDGVSPALDGAAQGHEEAEALQALDKIRSVRGGARLEYGKAHRLLQPFYVSVAKAPVLSASTVFSTFPDPVDQARILAQLRRFAEADTTLGWRERQENLLAIVGGFEDVAMREFETGCRAKDFDVGMRQYAHVLVTLNDGAAAIDYYIDHCRIMQERDDFGNPLECLEGCAPGHTDLGPSRSFFLRLSAGLDDEGPLIERVFPKQVDVFTPLLQRIEDKIISEYITTLFDEAHKQSVESYLKAVAGVLEQTINFVKSLDPPPGSADGFAERALQTVVRLFERHSDLFLRENFEFFKGRATSEVEAWTQHVFEKEANAETFYMSHVSRQAAKQDFLSSFKKVFMMPVNAFPTGSKASKEAPSGGTDSRPATPNFSTEQTAYSGFNKEAPTTELAAQTAIINSKLEGIGGLLSLEVALTLVHTAKSALERTANYMPLGGQCGAEAKTQCQNIFVELLKILGPKHVQLGFDKAIDALSRYNAREATEHGGNGVRPLVMFLELVNVGDLIQQMVDVFYVQELITPKIIDRDDFLNPANKSKKRFEQFLDESVGAGLGKGIDVLMDEVEYICATTQAATDFHPDAGAPPAGKAGARASELVMDIGPTRTAVQVVELLSTHTDMLIGTTDKHMLDVFNQEVGLRLFAALCKHLKRQRVSVQGAIKLISDTNLYFQYVQRLKNRELLQYFKALRELSQIFLVDGRHGKEIATIVADGDRYHGIFRAEEVYEFAERRADWYMIKGNVEKAMYGVGCAIM